MGLCNSSETVSPIDIPAFTEEVDSDGEESEGEEEEEPKYVSSSKNAKKVEKRERMTLITGWDTSGKVAVFTGDDSGEGILGYRFKSSTDSAATTMRVTDSNLVTNEDGVEATEVFDVIEQSDLISLVVRSPAEHSMNGERNDVEVQYFYESVANPGTFSALSVFYQADETSGDSALLQLVLGAKDTTFKLASYNDAMITSDSTFTKYEGQYTNPRNAGEGEIGDSSCEKVQWVILQDVQPMSAAQKDSFSARWMENENFLAEETYGNNRKIQDLKSTIYSNKYESSGATFIAATVATIGTLLSTFAF